MTVELGHFSLILALFIAVAQVVIPMRAARCGDIVWIAFARPAATLQFLLTALAFGTLVHAYIVSDFSVYTVAANSHTAKPLLYRITGVWANHEGSLVLWVMILSVFGVTLAWMDRTLPIFLRARILSIQAMISVGFLLFILFTSNPFQRLDPPVVEGQGLNPLLQDPGLAFHPPLLYFGYVGFSIVFSFSIAALIEGRADPAWAHWMRPWALAAWVFLTLGIVLGSWWAYYELGWGGWWFWDPVENAALIPWLSGTALLHAVILVEKRDTLKKWTILLSIVTFSLSLLGTFLVRSGILTSVHAFTADPARGVFILGLLSVTVGASLSLFAIKAPEFQGDGLFTLTSREGSLLFNNVLLSVIAATVLLGTLYPLLADAFGLGKLSVGAPFFNRTVVPLIVPLVVIMAIGPLLAWGRNNIGSVLRRLWPAAVSAIIVSLIAATIAKEQISLLASLVIGGSMGLSVWLGVATLIELTEHTRLFQIPLFEKMCQVVRLPRAPSGMTLSHFGLAILVAGVVGATAWNAESIVTMRRGESTELGGYTFILTTLESMTGPNYQVERGTITIYRAGTFVATLYPERRQYTNPLQLTTEAAIHTTGLVDLYTALGEGNTTKGVTVRLYYKPLVPLLWYGAGFMIIGGLVSLSDRRTHIKGAGEREGSSRLSFTRIHRGLKVLCVLSFCCLCLYF